MEEHGDVAGRAEGAIPVKLRVVGRTIDEAGQRHYGERGHEQGPEEGGQPRSADRAAPEVWTERGEWRVAGGTHGAAAFRTRCSLIPSPTCHTPNAALHHYSSPRPFTRLEEAPSEGSGTNGLGRTHIAA